MAAVSVGSLCNFQSKDAGTDLAHLSAASGCENIVKESKQDFGLEGFCLEKFYGTEAAMLVRALFYNLITLFRQQVLPQRESRHTLQTLRLKYFVIAAVFGRDGDSPVLRLGVSRQKLRQKILWVLKRLDTVGENRIAVKPQTS